jgi:fimbrial chaperone protein
MMKMRLSFAIALVAIACRPVDAATLRVAPIVLDLKNGATVSSVKVWNEDRTPLNVQARIFKWTVQNGKNVLEPTRDVVVSPPITTLAPGTENIVRVVRVAKQPVNGRESYRLIIDQLPDRSTAKPGTVSILVRHAIPVYFE